MLLPEASIGKLGTLGPEVIGSIMRDAAVFVSLSFRMNPECEGWPVWVRLLKTAPALHELLGLVAQLVRARA